MLVALSCGLVVRGELKGRRFCQTGIIQHGNPVLFRALAGSTLRFRKTSANLERIVAQARALGVLSRQSHINQT
jgi:hypothetical protein